MSRKKRNHKKYTPLGQAIVDATGLTQAKLARRWGVSQQTVSKRLRGESAISVADLTKLRKRCKIKIHLSVAGRIVGL